MPTPAFISEGLCRQPRFHYLLHPCLVLFLYRRDFDPHEPYAVFTFKTYSFVTMRSWVELVFVQEQTRSAKSRFYFGGLVSATAFIFFVTPMKAFVRTAGSLTSKYPYVISCGKTYGFVTARAWFQSRVVSGKRNRRNRFQLSWHLCPLQRCGICLETISGIIERAASTRAAPTDIQCSLVCTPPRAKIAIIPFVDNFILHTRSAGPTGTLAGRPAGRPS